MSQQSPGEKASNQAYKVASETAKTGYGIGIPGITSEIGGVTAGLQAGGEPSYLTSAWAGQRTGVAEALAGQDAASGAASAAGSKGAVLGGNVGAGLVPPSYGAKLAQALTGSRVNEALGKLQETTSLMGLGLGAGATAGNAGLRAGGAQLNAISMMQPYNTGTANVLGGLSLAGGMYGALAGTGGGMGDAMAGGAFGAQTGLAGIPGGA